MARLAVETRYWPLYEVVHGVCRLTEPPFRPQPIEAWLRPQARFRHLFQPEHRATLAEIQRQVDAEWEELLARCGSPVMSQTGTAAPGVHRSAAGSKDVRPRERRLPAGFLRQCSDRPRAQLKRSEAVHCIC
jgi:hypothetical protein